MITAAAPLALPPGGPAGESILGREVADDEMVLASRHAEAAADPLRAAGFDVETADGLGLQIVRTLLDSELDSALQVRARAGGGTEALIRLSLRGR